LIAKDNLDIKGGLLNGRIAGGIAVIACGIAPFREGWFSGWFSCFGCPGGRCLRLRVILILGGGSSCLVVLGSFILASLIRVLSVTCAVLSVSIGNCSSDCTSL
jgi:hypothetical protein